jgi:hypothetical protein
MKRVVRYPLLTILLMKINGRKTKLSNELVYEEKVTLIQTHRKSSLFSSYTIGWLSSTELLLNPSA